MRPSGSEFRCAAAAFITPCARADTLRRSNEPPRMTVSAPTADAVKMDRHAPAQA
jgi:hypothetical protein